MIWPRLRSCLCVPRGTATKLRKQDQFLGWRVVSANWIDQEGSL